MNTASLLARSRIPVSRKTRGFTLLELLTVMAIMFIMMGMALGAYFGLVKGTALSGAYDNLTKTLSLARQHAVTHRTRVYVLFETIASPMGGSNYSYEVVAQAGTHDAGFSGTPDLVVRNPRWVAGELVGGSVYNLTAGSKVTNIVANTDTIVQGPLRGGSRQVWNMGDRYGWLIHDAEYLPATLCYDGEPEDVVLLPDGTTERAGSGEYEINIREIRGLGRIQIKVDDISGLVQ